MESGLNSLLSAKEDLGLWARDEGKILKISCLPSYTGTEAPRPTFSRRTFMLYFSQSESQAS